MTETAVKTRRATVNRWAIASPVLAVLGIVGSFYFGYVVLVVFAVGAGHVALQQIARTGEQGRVYALVGLGLGYAIAVWSLIQGVIVSVLVGTGQSVAF